MTTIGKCLSFWLRHPQEMNDYFDTSDADIESGASRWAELSDQMYAVGTAACQDVSALLERCRDLITARGSTLGVEIKSKARASTVRDQWYWYGSVAPADGRSRRRSTDVQIGASIFDERSCLVPWIACPGRDEDWIARTLGTSVRGSRDFADDDWKPGTVAIALIPIEPNMDRESLLADLDKSLAFLNRDIVHTLMGLS